MIIQQHAELINASNVPLEAGTYRRTMKAAHRDISLKAVKTQKDTNICRDAATSGYIDLEEQVSHHAR